MLRILGEADRLNDPKHDHACKTKCKGNQLIINITMFVNGLATTSVRTDRRRDEESPAANAVTE